MKISFQHIFYALASLCLILGLMIVAKTVLAPLALSLLIAFILLPLARRLERIGMGKGLAAVTTIVLVMVLLSGVSFFFGSYLVGMMEELSEFKTKVMSTLTESVVFVNENIPFVAELDRAKVMSEMEARLLSISASLVQDTFNSTTAILTGIVTTLIFTAFFLIYRGALANAVVHFAVPEERERSMSLLNNIQQVGQRYLSGTLTLMLIIGTINSIGLSIIGVDSPVFFGFFAALLTIIPYLGTTLGSIIPVIYTFISQDTLWMPIAVAVMFWGVQTLEGYFLSPRVVGQSLNVNPFAAILSLFIGALIWGLMGVVMFLPFTAMLMVACREFDALRPIAMLIGNEGYGEEESESALSRWWTSLKEKRRVKKRPDSGSSLTDSE